MAGPWNGPKATREVEWSLVHSTSRSPPQQQHKRQQLRAQLAPAGGRAGFFPTSGMSTNRSTARPRRPEAEKNIRKPLIACPRVSSSPLRCQGMRQKPAGSGIMRRGVVSIRTCLGPLCEIQGPSDGGSGPSRRPAKANLFRRLMTGPMGLTRIVELPRSRWPPFPTVAFPSFACMACTMFFSPGTTKETRQKISTCFWALHASGFFPSHRTQPTWRIVHRSRPSRAVSTMEDRERSSFSPSKA